MGEKKAATSTDARAEEQARPKCDQLGRNYSTLIYFKLLFFDPKLTHMKEPVPKRIRDSASES